MTEKQIENSILEYLTLKGVFCWKNQSTGIFDPKKKVFRKSNNKFHINGVADILGCLNGQFIAIEVKRPKCYPSKHQKVFIKKVSDAGGKAIIARSIEDVQEQLGI